MKHLPVYISILAMIVGAIIWFVAKTEMVAAIGGGVIGWGVLSLLAWFLFFPINKPQGL